MANYVRFVVVIAIVVGVVCGEESNELEDVDRNILGLNLPYGRGLVSVRPSRAKWKLRGT